MKKLDKQESKDWEDMMVSFAFDQEEWTDARTTLIDLLEKDQKKPMKKRFVPIFPVVRSRRVTLILYLLFHLWFWNCTTPTAWIVPKRGSAGTGIYCSNFLWDSLTTTYFSAHDRIAQRFSSDKEFFILPGTPATNEPGGISIPMGTTVPAAMMD